jgi:predicted nucleic acid-binding protein
MGVVVFDSDVLIGFLNRQDAHHQQAITAVRAALKQQRRLLCAVNYSEIVIGPLRAGRQADVEAMLGQVMFEIIQVDGALARRAAAVRARTNLKLPDAYALATAIHAEHLGYTDVRLQSFDQRVLNAHAALHPHSDGG